MSVFLHASVTLKDGTATVRLTFVSDKIAEQYVALSKGAWRQKRPTDPHVTRVAVGYAGFRAYRDPFCLVFHTPDAAQQWLAGQEDALWTTDNREPDKGNGVTSVSLRNGIIYQDLRIRKPRVKKPGKRELEMRRKAKNGQPTSDSESSFEFNRRQNHNGSGSGQGAANPDSDSDVDSEASISREKHARRVRNKKSMKEKDKGLGGETVVDVIEEPDPVINSDSWLSGVDEDGIQSDSDSFHSLPGSDVVSEADRRGRSRSRSPRDPQERRQVLFSTSGSGPRAERRANHQHGQRNSHYDNVSGASNSGAKSRRRRSASPPDALEPSDHEYAWDRGRGVVVRSIVPRALPDRRRKDGRPMAEPSRQGVGRLHKEILPSGAPPPPPNMIGQVDKDRSQRFRSYRSNGRVIVEEMVVYKERKRSTSRSSSGGSRSGVGRMNRREMASHRPPSLSSSETSPDSSGTGSEEAKKANGSLRWRARLRNAFTAVVGVWDLKKRRKRNTR
jgi:hypothetical protein